MRTEIGEELANRVREIAETEGRSVEEVLEEAVRVYLESRRTEVEVAAWVNDRPERSEERPPDGFLALLGRMSARFDLDEDEAMRIAVEEQRAYRAERSERGRIER